MGHSCRICGRIRSNEKFSGKGHKNHICKDCSKKPRTEIDSIDQGEEIFGFLHQSNISKKNINRLAILKASSNKEISELASIAFEVAKVKPCKRRRLKFLAREHHDLLIKLRKSGLILAHHW